MITFFLLICNIKWIFFASVGNILVQFKNERMFLMTKKTMTAAKMIGAVMAVGGTAAMLTGAMSGSSSKRQVKKTADKAVKAINGIIDGIQSMM